MKEAEAFLREVLAEGELGAKEVYALAEQEGIKRKTLLNAKDKLGVLVTKKQNKWYWNLND